MSGITYNYMESYIKGLISEHSGILKELEDFASQNSVPIVQKEVGRFLELMINIKKPKNILELGTAIGYSAILMSLSSNGQSKITTIERNNDMINLAKGNFARFKYSENIKLIEGECLEILPEIEDKFDLIFMDAGKAHYNHFLSHCLRLLNKDGIIISDNALFRGMVASDELIDKRKTTIVKRMRDYLINISDSERFITSIIPMGDGVAVTVRRNENE